MDVTSRFGRFCKRLIYLSTSFNSEPQRAGLAELKTYLLTKLAWDPDYDVDQGISEFAHACYGPAAKQVLTYIKRINDPETYSYTPQSMRDLCTSTWGKSATIGPTPGFHLPHYASFPLKSSAIAQLNKLMDDAEQAATGGADALRRLKLLRMSLQYAILYHVDKDDPVYQRASAGFYATAELEGVPIPTGLASP